MANYIHYDAIVQASLLRAVRHILTKVEKDGLKGAHHFYISFLTDRPDVQIPAYLRERHPYEVTIVMQHQFWDLHVEEDHFSVTLSFNNNLETIRVPFSALLSFVDPSVKFGLQFSPGVSPDYLDESDAKPTKAAASSAKAGAASQPVAPSSGESPSASNVVTLDSFRKSSK